MAQVDYSNARRGEFVQPVATLDLMQKIGPTAAAKRLHTSTTRLYNARKKGTVAATVELASENVLKGLPDKAAAPVKLTAKQEPVLMLLEAPPEKARIIERLCKALGAKFVEA